MLYYSDMVGPAGPQKTGTSSRNSSIKMSSFEADLGFVPLNPLQLAPDQLGPIKVSRMGTAFFQKQAAVLFRYRNKLGSVQARMRDMYDFHRAEQEFKVGDQVYLSTKYLDPNHTGLPNSSKLGPKWIGMYSVVRRIHNHAYELNIQSGNRLHQVLNTSSLKPYSELSRASRPAEIILADGSAGQLVKRILGKRTRKQMAQFLVEWVGEDMSTWEPLRTWPRSRKCWRILKHLAAVNRKLKPQTWRNINNRR